MTSVLETALAQVAKLPPAEQDVLASLLMDEMKSEGAWAHSFAQSQGLLKSLAADALQEHRAGRTQPLDKLF